MGDAPQPAIASPWRQVFMEPRQDPRFPVRFRSFFSARDMVGGEGRVIELSLRGCRIESDTSVPFGTYLVLQVLLPEPELPLTVEVGQVRWSSGREFGLAFFSMRAEERERLGQLLTTLEQGPGS